MGFPPKPEVTKIILAEKASPPKIEVHVSFREENQSCNQGGSVNTYLNYQDYTISQIKADAMKGAKELLKKAGSSEQN